MITYNHEAFIRTAIHSVLEQETSFPYELVISNDHSPDNTDEIIREIISTHPNAGVIRYICHLENLGMMRNSMHNLKQCRGEYIAFCEGDDAWTDPRKLEIQIAAMREHPACELSFHPAFVFSGNTVTRSLYGFHQMRSRVFSPAEMIKGGGEFCPTASLVFKSSVIQTLPDFLQEAPIGDYFIQIVGSLRGGALYINKAMSIYRIHTNISWTTTLNCAAKRAAFFENYAKSVQMLNLYLNRFYETEFFFEITRHYRNLSLTYLKNNSIREYKLLYQQNKENHRNTLGIKVLYYIGRLTRSEKAASWFDRLFLIHPNPVHRIFKKIMQFQFIRCNPPAKLARGPQFRASHEKISQPSHRDDVVR